MRGIGRALAGAALITLMTLMAGIALSACGGEEVAVDGSIKASLLAIKDARILFGHQSVGRDILDGLQALAKREGVELRVTDLPDGPASGPGPASRPNAGPGIEHFRVGKNREPELKCGDFLRHVEASGASYDAAILKFCYVDVTAKTDVDAVFGRYRETVDKARAAVPGLVLIHATLPLKADPVGLKAKVKRLLRRDPGNDVDNEKRNAFNRKLLAAYAGDPVFDLAKAESTLPDGSRVTFEAEGKEQYRMAGEYTHDEGHLNARGQAWVAAEFARALATALNRKAVAGP
ncbi:MAG TPA: hypothetical protein VK465_18110 [Fibrobacteria bacterium]|nr:hypothetical protein [Fibrobacteria bacterium]